MRLKVYTEVFQTLDFTWTLTTSENWDVIMANVGIACVCMPCLKPLLQKHAAGLFRLTSKVRSGSSKKSNRSTSAVKGSDKPAAPDHVDGPYLELKTQLEHGATAAVHSKLRPVSDELIDSPPPDGWIIKTVDVQTSHGDMTEHVREGILERLVKMGG